MQKEKRRIARRAFLDSNAALREGGKGLRKTTSAATTHRINDTLSSALSWGIKREQESGDNLVSFRTKQDRKRQEWGTAYVESGRVWTHENGEELHPDWISRRFTRLVELSGLPPVRLHDLRHLAATLSLLAGHDIKVVQEKLGHSSRQITSDTYTSVLPEMMRAEAESVMAVVPRDIPFIVRTPLSIPETARRNNIAVFFAHGARQSDGTWAVGAQPSPALLSSA
ncbi:tyrosine-type recombinase/integrase [Streptomyces sp. NPDC059896]|uniref:tyrosine-type recombinase/integrase n=1 Tax=Streptomyces sp. NPDC059896 TaxID=3346993 RepID=UPI0036579310